jgi:FixJ family two-component response regulator
MVYIVDDDPNIRDAFEMLLKSVNYKCKSYENAELFLENYVVGEKDLLILDMHLTGMSGCDLLKKISQRGLHIPTIVVTAFDEPKYREYCREYGVLAFLRKPVDSIALIDLIKYNLENRLSTYKTQL